MKAKGEIPTQLLPFISSGLSTFDTKFKFLVPFRYDDTNRGCSLFPPGGDGWYYFFAYFRVNGDEIALFNIELNGNYLCTMVEGTILEKKTGADGSQGGCGTVVYATEGNTNYFYRPQRSWAKVISLQASVCPHGGCA